MSILNEIYPSHLANKRHLTAGLSATDSKTLDDLEIYIIKSKKIEEIITKTSVDEACMDYVLDKLIPICKKYVRYDKEGMPLSSKPYPLKVIQVLYLASAYYPTYKQSKIIAKFEDNNLKLSKKMFNKDVYIDDIRGMLVHNQPTMHINYQGQKHGDLAVAIKNIVHQAGYYDVFASIFGGSGGCLTSIQHSFKRKYIYNDLDIGLCKLFDVIQSDKYETLIEYIECLKKDLKDDLIVIEGDSKESGEQWNIGVDFTDEVNKRILAKQAAGKKIENAKEEIKLMDWLNVEITTGYKKEENVIDTIEQFLNYTRKLDTSILEPFLLKYFPSILSDDENIDLPSIVLSWYQNNKEILDFARENNIPLPNMYEDNEGAMAGHTELRQLQYRYYKWYIYFDNILSGVSQTDDDVMIALAEIFRWTLTTNGKSDLSAIYRIIRPAYNNKGKENKDSNDFLNFYNTNYEDIIPKVHSVIRGSQVQNKDCFQFIEDTNKLMKTYKVLDKGGKRTIEKTEPCDVLYYSDYPYQGTSGYVAGGWTANDSIRLISDLESSDKKFIFSCRANISKNDEDKLTNNDKKENVLLKSSVFDKFTKAQSVVYIKSLTGVSLAEAIAHSKVTELMITNFEVEPFDKPDKFEFYSYADFMKILERNLQK